MSKTLAKPFRDRKSWLEARRKTLGGSDVPSALFGQGFKSALAVQYDKLGLLPDSEPSARFKIGLAVEPVAAEIAEERLGWPVVEPSKDGPVCYYSTDAPALHATPDRFVLSERPKRIHAAHLPGKARAVLSLKTWVSARRDDWGTAPPLYALLQLVTEMLVTGVHVGAVHVMFGLAEDQATYPEIEYPETLGERIRHEAPLWWQRHIVERQPVRAVAADQDLLRQIYPESKPHSFLVLSGPEWERCYRQLSKAKRLSKKIDEVIDSMETKFKEALGETEYGLLSPTEAVSWKSYLRNDPPREAKSYPVRPMRLAKPPKEVLAAAYPEEEKPA